MRAGRRSIPTIATASARSGGTPPTAGRSYAAEFRFLRPDGEVRWVAGARHGPARCRRAT